MSIAPPPPADVTPHPDPGSRAERAAQTHRLLVEARHCEDPEHARSLRARAVLLNQPVAESVAARYRNRGISHEDLTQVAYEGLAKAAARFDPTLRHDFLSFAVPTIRGEVQRHFRDQGWMVRPPRRLQEVQAQARAAAEELRQALGHEPDEQEAAEALDVPTEDYREAVAARGCFRPTSMDLPVGSELGISQMQVSRLLTRILARLRRSLDPEGRLAGDSSAAA